MSLKRTMNPMSPVTNRIIPSRRTFSQGSRIPAGSMDPTNSTDPVINQKLLTLLPQPLWLVASCGNWRTGCSYGFSVHVSQSEGQIRGHVTSTWAFLKEMQEHHNGGDSHQVRYNSPYRGVGP